MARSVVTTSNALSPTYVAASALKSFEGGLVTSCAAARRGRPANITATIIRRQHMSPARCAGRAHRARSHGRRWTYFSEQREESIFLKRPSDSPEWRRLPNAVLSDDTQSRLELTCQFSLVEDAPARENRRAML